MVENTIKELFEKNGVRLEVDVSRPFLSNDADKVWYIEKGSINLSATKVVGEEAVGKIVDFITLDQGQAFFGVRLKDYKSLCFIADPEEESVLYELPLETLKSWGEIDNKKGLILDDFVRNWVTTLYMGLEKEGSNVEIDHNIRVGWRGDVQKNEVISTKHNIVWLQASNHKALVFNDLVQLEKDRSDIFIPISRYGFIKTNEDVSIVAEKPEPIVYKEEYWKGLGVFHDMVMAIELLIFNQKEHAETKRLIRKHQYEEEEMSSMLEKATSVLRSEKADPYFFQEAQTKNIFYNACKVVASNNDIELVMPPNLEDVDDPLDEICRYSSVRYREIMLEGEWNNNDGGPFIGFLIEKNKPMALLPKGRGYMAVDVESKEKLLVTSSNIKDFKNYGYMFYKPLPSIKIGIKELFNFSISKDKTDYLWILIMALSVTILGMLAPVLTAIIFDDIVPNAHMDQLLYVAFGLSMAAMGSFLFNLTKSIALLRVESKMDQQLQAGVWDRLLNLPTYFFQNFSAGDLAARSLGIGQIRKILSDVAISSILASVFSTLNLILLFYYSSSLAWYALLLVAIQVAVNYSLGRKQIVKQKKLLESSGKSAGIVLQLLTGITKFRVTGTERRAFNHWMRVYLPVKEISLALKRLQNFQLIFNRNFGMVSTMMIFILMIKMIKGPAMSIGEFLSFSAAYGIFSTAMMQVSRSLITSLKVIPLYERTKPILEEEPENTEAKEAPEELKGNIELNDIHFRYDKDDDYILENLSMNIKKGEFVALVGPSGSGKSTLIRLLLGFNNIESGTIYFDGQDLSHLDAQMLRRMIGVVLQDGSLVAGDIFTNIIGSSTTLTMEDAWAAARAAAFDKDIERMPMGMYTIVSESGGTISGGQRQRLMIARALVHKPKILIFDEATSALDNHTQGIVSESLDQLNVTRIVVAHRLSTIKNADTIYYLEGGSISEKGNFEELMELEGKFHGLAKRQIE